MNTPDAELIQTARAKLVDSITVDAIEAEGPFHQLHIERGLPPIWVPKSNTMKWAWIRRSRLFAFVMDSSNSQVDAWWAEGMDKAYVAHNG